MLTDAANVIFQTAKRRCYTLSKKLADQPSNVDDLLDDDAWDALDEMEGRVKRTVPKAWIPEGMDPVLEELPKWELLSDVLQEIEEEILRQESLTSACFIMIILPQGSLNGRCERFEYGVSYDFILPIIRSCQRVPFRDGRRCAQRPAWSKNDGGEAAPISVLEGYTRKPEARWKESIAWHSADES